MNEKLQGCITLSLRDSFLSKIRDTSLLESMNQKVKNFGDFILEILPTKRLNKDGTFIFNQTHLNFMKQTFCNVEVQFTTKVS